MSLCCGSPVRHNSVPFDPCSFPSAGLNSSVEVANAGIFSLRPRDAISRRCATNINDNLIISVVETGSRSVCPSLSFGMFFDGQKDFYTLPDYD